MRVYWLGGDAGQVRPRTKEVHSDMTAIAVVCHPSGFGLAADGRFSWQIKPAPNAVEESRPLDREQKIFPFHFHGRTMAFVLTGASSNSLGTFSVISEMLASLKDGSRSCNDVWQLIGRSARQLKHAIEVARKDGRLPPDFRNDERVAEEDGTFTITRIFLVGYFSKKKPTLAHVRLFHRDQIVCEPSLNFSTPPTNSHYAGSTEIYRLLFETADERFAKHRVVLTRESSITDVVACATGFVEACSGPLAESIDELCKGIGGHIHSAIITQQDGFAWIRPPASFHP